ncbi:ribonuclease P/MRP protein subunit [Lipomyces arxii]|uniref:ribonuclease P/MRP protein subunit n=1 Tax=Lipomyces arxii TaxID=56418 RepID=UPI0034CEEA73
MVRFKSRYLLFKLHYPQQNDVDAVLPERQKSIYPSRYNFKKQKALSDGNILPGGTEGNLQPDMRTVLEKRPSPDVITQRALNAAIRDIVNRSFGDLGAGLVRASISLKYFSPATSTGIIRVSRDHFQMVWAALTLLNEIAGVDVIVSVDHVSGTMRKCERFAMTKDASLIRQVDAPAT